MKKKRAVLLTVSAAGLICALLSPVTVSRAIRDALRLCADTLVPSLFPYMVFTSLLAKALTAEAITVSGSRKNRTGRLIFVLGALSGYPTGAKTVVELYRAGQLTKEESHRLLFFSCNAGPAFIFGVIGSLYASLPVCMAIMIIHLGSAWLLGLMLPKKKTVSDKGSAHKAVPLPPFSECLLDAVQSAVHTLLKIAGLVCVFSLITAVERKVLLQFHAFLPVLSIFTELASGCALLAGSSLSWALKFTVTAAAVSFGGLCVLLQTASVLSGSGLSLRHYAAGKLLQAVISAAAAWPVSKLLATSLPVASVATTNLHLSPWPWALFSAATVLAVFLQFSSSNFSGHEL